MQKRSALTAALSGQPEAEIPAPAPIITKKLDPSSFPCIKEDEVAAGEAFEGLRLDGGSPVGSVPTAGLLPNGSAAVSFPPFLIVQTSARVFACIGRRAFRLSHISS